MISDILAVVDFFDKHLERASILKAYFSSNGEKIYGSSEIEVDILPIGKGTQWFYNIKPHKDFVFIPFPVNPAVYFDYGKYENQRNSTSNLFRFVGNPLSTFQTGGADNLLTDFMVFGYKPSDLLEKRELRP